MRIPSDATIDDTKLTDYLLVQRPWDDKMSLPLYDRVALRTSFPEYALRAGDVATLVDFVEHPSSGPRGCVLELFNALGESIAVVTVPEDAIEPLRADEVLAVRPVAAAR